MALNNAQLLSIGVDLGGTSLRIAAYTPGIGLLDSLQLRTRLEAGPSAVVDDMCDGIRQLHDRYSEGREFAGIGVGSPGPLELPAGRLHHPPNLPGWDGFPLLAEMEKRLERPVVLESDANAAVLAEYELGLGKELGIDSMCMLTLGTGVGNGIILDGKLWHGSTGMGGEAGHMTVDPEGALCGCGNNGCLEVCASATAIVNAAERMISLGKAPGLSRIKGKETTLTAQGLADAARQGDPEARAIYAETGRSLGICLAGLINILNLPLYVIGGGVANSWDLFSSDLFEELERRSYVYSLTAPGRVASNGMPGRGTRILPARLGSEAGLLGACILPGYLLKPRYASA
jgi:glucokinase